MRSLVTDQLKVLTAPGGYSVRVRVSILTDAGWIALDDLAGHDWLEGVDCGGTVDEPVSQATVNLRRDIGALSLAPLRTDSKLNNLSGTYDPLIHEGRQFKVFAACVPLGMEATSGQWVEVFHGEIDDLDAASDVLSFTGRDYGGARMQDAFIEIERVYGAEGATTPVETVMQSILTDNGLPFVLQIPAGMTPGWELSQYRQDREPVLDALQALAAQIGWEVRYRWLSGYGWAVCLQEPQRTKTAPDWTFSADDYEEVSTCRTDRAEVRNVWEVVFSDKGDLDHEGLPKRKTVPAVDAGSVAVHGRRWAQIAESDTSAIDTYAEAERMANAALADTKDVLFEKTVVIPFHFALELGDLLELDANGVHYDADQRMAVVSLQHDLTNGKSTVTVRGKPSLGTAFWLRREARPGVGEGSNFTGPFRLADANLQAKVEGLVLAVKPNPRGPRPEEYEVHVSTVPGFTPSQWTIRGASKSTQIAVEGLDPGRSYYVKAVPRAADGSLGPASDELTVSAGHLRAVSMPEKLVVGPLPFNGDFEAVSSGLVPDGWGVLTGGENGTNFTTSTNLEMVDSGSRSLEVALFDKDETAPQLAGRLFPVDSGKEVLFRARALAVGNIAHGQPFVDLVFYSGEGTGQVDSVRLWVPFGGTFANLTATRTPPASARWARVVVGAVGNMAAPRPADVFGYVSSVKVERNVSAGAGGPVAAVDVLVTPSGNLGATNAQTAFEELQADVDSRLPLTGGTLTGSLVAESINAQSAEFNGEVYAEGELVWHAGNFDPASKANAVHTHSYQPLDADLTAIAGLTGTSGFLKKTAANTWTLDPGIGGGGVQAHAEWNGTPTQIPKGEITPLVVDVERYDDGNNVDASGVPWEFDCPDNGRYRVEVGLQINTVSMAAPESWVALAYYDGLNYIPVKYLDRRWNEGDLSEWLFFRGSVTVNLSGGEKYYVVAYQDSDEEWALDNIDAQSGWIAITDA